ncbi:heme ABC transporter ATP-binding protein/permease CydC [Ferrimonas gelatinilytica]|uniref:Cysteine/glutathione ABC transporter ATP-binding protein/permease CydC n=1 Tax=Ferrimonas gelatinilytica TaxID=1255257 RepID=A0ABP9RXL9_9GAMM
MTELIPFLRLFQQHWRRLALGALLSLLTLLASIGLLSLSGWFIAASAVAGLVISRSADFNYMMPAGGVRALSVLRTAARWAERVVSHDATFRLLATLRSWFFRHLGRLAPARLGGLRDADLLNRMVADIDALDHLYLRLITPVAAGSLSILAVTVFLSWIDPLLGAVLGGVLLALLLLLPPLFYRLGLRPGERLSHHHGVYRQQLADYIDAQTELLLFQAERQQREKLAHTEQALLLAQGKMARLTGLSQGLLTLFNGWLLLVMVVLAHHQLSQGGAPGPLLALVAFATLASFEALNPVTTAFQHLGHTLAAARRLTPMLSADGAMAFGGQTQPGEERGLAIQGLNFRYPGALDPTLDGLNLTLEPGERVALIGQTGCGKSTLLQILCRELESDSGSVCLNGHALDSYCENSLRQQLCVISQRVHIFNDSLANNLRLASPGATDDQLEQALRQVKLDKLLEGQGLAQWLGEGGRQLSGGEQRRIGLARALLHPGSLLLLDEPTEGLDDATEQEVISCLLSHRPERTLLYVTHKPAALAQMDRVLMMEAGKLKPAHDK